VKLTIHDALEREVARLVDGYGDAGSHDVVLDGLNWASGVYYARYSVSTGRGNANTSQVTQLLLVR
jgi:hypothetical protein